MESQPQNPEFKNNPENFHPCVTKNLNPTNGYKGIHVVHYIILQAKRALRPWVALLRMIVYKGTGKRPPPPPPQSPAMNFDRSA